jgi:uncharacterized protein YwgA
MADIEKVIAFFKELDFHFNINNFEDRLIAQKIICLLQLKNIDLGYPSDLYVRGPYSPVLTKDLYQNERSISNFETDVTLNKKEKETIIQLKELFGFSSSLLEIAATYGYLNQRLHLDHLNSLSNLKKMKPFYSEPKIALGVSKAKQFFSSISEEQMSEMKEEFSAWQEASFFR